MSIPKVLPMQPARPAPVPNMQPAKPAPIPSPTPAPQKGPDYQGDPTL